MGLSEARLEFKGNNIFFYLLMYYLFEDLGDDTQDRDRSVVPMFLENIMP